MQLLTLAANQRAALFNQGTARQKADLVRSIISEIGVSSGVLQVKVDLNAIGRELLASKNHAAEDAAPIVLEQPFQVARRGSEARLILSDGKAAQQQPIPALISAVVQARIWTEWIIAGKVTSLSQLAEQAGRSRQYTSRVLRLAALSPDLADAVVQGDHPPLSPCRN